MAAAPHSREPGPDGRDHKLGSIGSDADSDGGGVRRHMVDAVSHHLAGLLVLEGVHPLPVREASEHFREDRTEATATVTGRFQRMAPSAGVRPADIGLTLASATRKCPHGRGRSSDGRALQSHCRGQGFDSPRLHQVSLPPLISLGFLAMNPKPFGPVWESDFGFGGERRRIAAWASFFCSAALV